MENLTLIPSGHGHYKVIYYTKTGRQKTGITNDMCAVDRYKNTELSPNERKTYGLTKKQAFLSLKGSTKK